MTEKPKPTKVNFWARAELIKLFQETAHRHNLINADGSYNRTEAIHKTFEDLTEKVKKLSEESAKNLSYSLLKNQVEALSRQNQEILTILKGDLSVDRPKTET